jgi:hypothetical protein
MYVPNVVVLHPERPVVPTGPATVGKPPWHSRTPRHRGAPIGVSAMALRQGDPTTPSPWQRPGPRVDPMEG